MGKYTVFNYAQTHSNLTANDVPTTIPPEIMQTIEAGNSNQFYSVESIPYPAMGNSHIPGTPARYEEGYFIALNECLKKKPIPGSKNGHEDKQKSSNDVFVVGSRIDSNGDGTGIAHFKIIIPGNAYNGESNEGLIRDAKLGMLNYSFVSSPVYDIKMVNGMREYHVIGSNGGDRNDVVDTGAMDQIVNSKEEIDFEELSDLIKKKKVTKEDIDGEVIQNGLVSRPVLRRIVSHADCKNKAEISAVISAIDKVLNGGNKVELNEALEMVKNSIANGAVAFADVAKSIGIEKYVKNSEDEKAIVLAENMRKKLGDNPETALDSIIAENSANAETAVKNAVILAFGAEKIENGAESIDNPAYGYAMDKVKNMKGDALAKGIEALKEDAVIKLINSKKADINSDVNRLASGSKQKVENGYMGHKVINIGGNK